MSDRERFNGTVNLFSDVRLLHISSALTVFDDGSKAGFVVGSLDPDDHRREQVAFDHFFWLIGMRMLIGVLHDIGGYEFVDPNEAIRAQRKRQMECPRCLGAGQVEDFEGNWIGCPECG